LITMLIRNFSRCDSIAEVCDGMQTLQEKLNCFGMDSSSATSTTGDGKRNQIFIYLPSDQEY